MMLRVRSALCGMVFEKSLRMSSAGRKDTTTGEIVNLMSSDADKVGTGLSMGITSCFLVPAQGLPPIFTHADSLF